MKRTNALEEKSQPASQACLLAHAFATAPTIPAVHLSMSALSFCITLCSPRTEKQGWTIMFATASGMGHVRHPSRVVSYVRFSRGTQATSTLETMMISFEQKHKNPRKRNYENGPKSPPKDITSTDPRGTTAYIHSTPLR